MPTLNLNIRLPLTSLLAFGWLLSPLSAQAQTLEQRLRAVKPEVLWQRADSSGSAVRGAILFHGPHLGCGKCHAVSQAGPESLGPRLVGSPIVDQAQMTDEELGAHIVMSILEPSAQVPEAYRPLRILTEDGQILSGLKLPNPSDSQTLRLKDLGTLEELEIAKSDIAEMRIEEQSIMPKGIVAGLTSESEFLDLLQYLREIRAGGERRARELQPSEAQLAVQLPEYEADIDHRGMIEAWDKAAMARGREVYMGLCVNCHGTLEQAGSLATAPRFAESKLKYGSDPYSIYKTLTQGAGLMVAQSWMVPQQKYDVIHYLREKFFRHNAQLGSLDFDEDYLAGLPRGTQRGPKPKKIEPWTEADYGPRLVNTYEVGEGGDNIAYKGIALQLDNTPGGVANGRAWAVFDHDTLRIAGVWTGAGFIDWHGIHFDGRHNVHPHTVGRTLIANPSGPGWADPRNGSLEDDARVKGRDGRRYGPLPRKWAQFKGFRQLGHATEIVYTVGGTEIHERFGWLDIDPAAPDSGLFTRTLVLEPHDEPLQLVVATAEPVDDAWTIDGGLAYSSAAFSNAANSTGAKPGQPSDGQGTPPIITGIRGAIDGLQWLSVDGRLLLNIPSSSDSKSITVWVADAQHGSTASALNETPSEVAGTKTNAVAGAQTRAPRQWREIATRLLTNADPLAASDTLENFRETIETSLLPGEPAHGFAVDELQVPVVNPWRARVRLTGLDFFSDPDRLAVCTWDGDVWLVRGVANREGNAKLQWQRIAFGLFQPLGLKIIDDKIYLTCRDQLLRLDDEDGDEYIDYYHCVNNDHQVTEHFHEFAMGLQTDTDGNFYYAKSARHALTAVVPHHGTLLRVSSDGERTDILATGFRAANGVCLNPDGTFIVTDQEGHWNPKNRINWVEPGGFYGNMYGYHDVTDESDSAMAQPLCWITNSFDRSPAELLWADSPAWGPLSGSLLNMSYGYGKLYVVPHERTADGVQGGMCELPIPQLPTGIVRGRFSPHDQQLVICGMSAWATSQTQRDGGLYRVRYTGGAAALPIDLKAHAAGVTIRFSEPLGAATSLDPRNYGIDVWSLKRTKNYGSDHYDERSLEITQVGLSADRRTLELSVPKIAPTWGMEIRLNVVDGDGQAVERIIHNTIHTLGEP